MTGMIVLTVVVLLILFWGVGAYSRLVGLQNQVKNAFSLVDVHLKRRDDLIPHFVEAAKGYMKHERETLEAVIVARNQAANASAKAAANPYDAGAVRQMVSAEGMLSATLAKLMLLADSCAELKADDNIARRIDEITSTASRIAFSRQVYNDAVMQYNASRAQFPSSIIAGIFAFRRAEPLQSPTA